MDGGFDNVQGRVLAAFVVVVLSQDTYRTDSIKVIVWVPRAALDCLSQPIDSFCFIFKTLFYLPPQRWGHRRGPTQGGSAGPGWAYRFRYAGVGTGPR